MPQEKNLVSVIIPVYNGGQYFAEAVKSVLDQTYRPIEVLVVDDGSTDGTAKVAEGFGTSIRYVFQENAGRCSARNRGIDLAQGDFLAFLDADDIWSPEKLSIQVAAFETDPSLDLVFGLIKNFRSPELPDEVKDKIHCPEELMLGYSVCTLLAKRDVFSRVGRFDTSLQVGEFVDWFSRAKEKEVRAIMLPQLVTRRRLYRIGDTASQSRFVSDCFKALKASLDRKRTKL